PATAGSVAWHRIGLGLSYRRGSWLRRYGRGDAPFRLVRGRIGAGGLPGSYGPGVRRHSRRIRRGSIGVLRLFGDGRDRSLGRRVRISRVARGQYAGSGDSGNCDEAEGDRLLRTPPLSARFPSA
ncbi:MAG: hypothetical protein LC799_25250, partial [Actinobacteria bacterium]|nr:hypothetical protein [Actinomycetota bacterium]